MNRYFNVPGMMYPWWIAYEAQGWPNPGDSTIVVHNAEADTDMGDLDLDEFEAMFPHAVELTKEEFDARL